MRQWAISIGINQYQSFQPLGYAQHDAQAIQQFLMDAGVPSEQCVLLTETSPSLWGKSTYPDRETIQNWLDFITQRCVQPGDILWFFFSGYGLCQQGQDYLMPIGGTPTAVQATALPLEAIFRSLRRVSDATVLVLLDMNRNGSSFSYETVGTHTAHLASITGIPTLLSCQPEQFSQETSALGHGFFTAALLESLRSRQCATVAALAQMLSVRLPALSEHYWRPVQQPVTVCPVEKRQQQLLLTAPLAPDSVGDREPTMQAAITNGAAFLAMQTVTSAGGLKLATASGNSPRSGNGNGNGLWAPAGTTATATANGALANPIADTNGNGVSDAYSRGAGYANGGTIATSSARPDPDGASPHTGHAAPSNVMPFGNGFAPAPPTPQNGFGNHKPLDTPAQNYDNGVHPPDRSPPVPQPHSDVSEDVNDLADALFWRSVLRWGGLAVIGLILGVLLRNYAAFTPKAPSTVRQPATTGTGKVGAAQTGTGKPPMPSSPAEAQSGVPATASTAPVSYSRALQPIASTQLGASGASRLNMSAGNSAPAQPQPTQATLTANTAKLSVASQLAKARALVTVNSADASPYSKAIQEAKKVPPGQPDYPQAKQAIADWSSQILRIARQRGRQGRYDAAIVAVKLIPPDQPVHAEAKSALDRWCPALKKQRGVNPIQRDQAKQICLKGVG